MANTILHKRSTTPGAVPLAGSLSYGELALNIADGKIFTKLSNDTVVDLVDYTSATSASEILASLITVDGAGSSLDADLLDGQQGTYYLDWTNTTSKPAPVITLAGDASGSVTLTDLTSQTLTVTIAATDILSKLLTVDGSTSGIDADLLDGQQGTYYLDYTNFSNIPSDFTPNAEATQDIVGAMVTGNTENGIAVTYDDVNAILNFDVADFDITLSGDVSGTATVTNLSNTSITVTVADDSHNHVSSNITDLAANVQTIVGAMVTGNTENGISVTYGAGVLDFDVNDPIITLDGDVSGSATMTNLGNTTITTTVADNSHNHTIANVTGLQSALDAKLDSTSYTASDILSKLITVDGTGSGLDADTLDGVNSTSFLRSDAADTFTTGDLTIDAAASISWATAPTNGNHLTNKTYVDQLVSAGTVWRDPIRDPNFIGVTATEPGSPQTSTGYIATASGTWTGSVSVTAGDYMYWDGSAWTKVQNPVVAGNRFLIGGENGTIETSLYDLGFRQYDLVEYVSGSYDNFSSWSTPSDAGYQVIGFTVAKSGSDSTGLANTATVYVLDVSTDVGSGETLAQVQVTGSAAQTFTNLVTQINVDLDATFGASNVVATLEPEGHIHITNSATSSRLTISEGTAAGTGMLSVLTNFDAIYAGNDDGTTVIDNDPDSTHYGHTYNYAHEGNTWTEIAGPGSIVAGNNLSYSGNTLNVVGGSGSGLDADLLDGLNSGQYLRSDAADTFTSPLTANGTGDIFILDSGHARITMHDGNGNFNLRYGNQYSGGEIYSTTGNGAAHVRLDGDGANGSVYLRVASIGTAGNAITWENTVNVTPTQTTFSNDIAVTGTTTVTHTSGTYGSAGVISERNSATDTVAFGLYNTSQKWDLANIVSTTPDIFLIRDVTGGTNPFKIEAGAPTNSLVIDSTGSIGFGTVTPAHQLHITTSTTNSVAQIESTWTSGSARLMLTANSSGSSYIDFGDEANNTIGRINYSHATDSMNFNVNGSESMRITSAGRLGIGYSSPGNALLAANNHTNPLLTDSDALYNESGSEIQAWNLNDAGLYSGINLRTRSTGASTWVIANEWTSSYLGDLVFRARTGGSASAEMMRLTSAGKIGLGVASPSYMLDVAGNGGIMQLRPSDTANASNYYIDVDSTSVSFAFNGSYNAGWNQPNGAVGSQLVAMTAGRYSWSFADAGTVDGDPITFIEKMRLDNTGKLGIGTNSPDEILHVVGNIQLTDGSPDIFFETSGTHRNWRVSAQETLSEAFEIAVGDQDADITNDTFTTILTIAGNQTVGVGLGNNSQPQDKLHIYNAAGSTHLRVETGNATNAGLILKNSVKQMELILDSVGNFQLYNDSTSTLLVKVMSSGWVGLGTASTPQQLLHLQSATAGGTGLLLESTATDGYPFIQFKNDVQEYRIYGSDGSIGDRFGIYDQTSAAYRFVIDTTGHVGIGYSAPTTLLHTGNGIVRVGSTGEDYATLSGGAGYGAQLALRYATTSSNNCLLSGNSGSYVNVETGTFNVGTSTTSSIHKLNVSGSAIFAAKIAATGEAYATSSSGKGSLYYPAGTIIAIEAEQNSVNSGALIDFNAYNSTNGATNVFIGAIAGSVANDSAEFVIGRRTGATSWTESLRINNNGDVAITPDAITNQKAWSGNKGIQIGDYGALWGYPGQINISCGAYYNSGWKYLHSDYATYYYQTNGSHQFRYASSGTADNGVTWSDGLVIANDGGVRVGSPTGGSKGANTLNAGALYINGVQMPTLYQGCYANGGTDALPSGWSAASQGTGKVRITHNLGISTAGTYPYGWFSTATVLSGGGGVATITNITTNYFEIWTYDFTGALANHSSIFNVQYG